MQLRLANAQPGRRLPNCGMIWHVLKRPSLIPVRVRVGGDSSLPAPTRLFGRTTMPPAALRVSCPALAWVNARMALTLSMWSASSAGSEMSESQIHYAPVRQHGLVGLHGSHSDRVAGNSEVSRGLFRLPTAYKRKRPRTSRPERPIILGDVAICRFPRLAGSCPHASRSARPSQPRPSCQMGIHLRGKGLPAASRRPARRRVHYN